MGRNQGGLPGRGVVPELGSEDGRVWTVGHKEERRSMPWKQHWQRLRAVPEMQRWYTPNIHEAGIDKQIVVYSQNGILSIDKMYKLLIYGTSWMKLKKIVCQTKKEAMYKRVYVI